MDNDKRQQARLLSSLRLKVTLAIFITGLLAAFSGLVYLLVSQVFDHHSAAVRQDLGWKAVQGARELAQTADLGIAVADAAVIKGVTAEYRRSPDLHAIVVQDAKGKVLFQHLDVNARFPDPFIGVEGSLKQGVGYLWAWNKSHIEGSTIGRVAIAMSLDRLKQGQVLRRRVMMVGAAGAGAALVVSLLFVGLYLGPLLRFTEKTLLALQDLNATLEQRVSARTAELRLANDQLVASLDRIQTMQRQLVDASRRAGMADVATSVLHNVGNVLNSINVSANLAMETMMASRMGGLAKAVQMLEANSENLGQFLTSDPRGKKLPAYLQALATAAQDERASVMKELGSLHKSLDHIKAVIARQQTLAKHSVSVVESVVIAELVEDALLSTGMTKEPFEIVRQFEFDGPVVVDRHKVLQILGNLLTNARHAIKARGADARVTVRLLPCAPDSVSIEVEDTGCGIAAADLDRVFVHGFTTKKEGHGFGLHGSACAAMEMGGRLTVRSPGVGQGATFSVTLPVRPPPAPLEAPAPARATTTTTTTTTASAP